MRAVVGNTDRAWFDHFRPTDTLTQWDEVNFWRPQAQSRFGALSIGEPYFFRLKAPVNAIAGFGFFAVESVLSVALAWDVFGERNGDPTYDRFLRRIAGYRRSQVADLATMSRQSLSCLVLREAVFLPESMWIGWRDAQEWARNIVSYKTFDLTTGSGLLLSSLLHRVPAADVADLAPEFVPLDEAMQPETTLRLVAERQGQGTFRARLLTAYAGRCAVTSERSVPVLDAAHIQSYRGPGSNHVQNGLLLRADLHRLYDAGYLTVTPELRVDVSPRLREDYENGRHYYAMAGDRIRVPDNQSLQPSRAALDWHASNVFH